VYSIMGLSMSLLGPAGAGHSRTFVISYFVARYMVYI
jgi:hypothetical protein